MDWIARFEATSEPVEKPAPTSIAGMRAGESMLVSTPRMVDDFMRAIPPGVHVDVATMRRRLAVAHGAEVTCPISTGYHLRTVAEAAHERLERGMPLEAVTPFWRVLDSRTPTTRRLSFGGDFVAAQRQREGLPS